MLINYVICFSESISIIMKTISLIKLYMYNLLPNKLFNKHFKFYYNFNLTLQHKNVSDMLLI